MEIFGLGIIGACMFIGSYIGRLLGTALGLDSDVGGVGFAMVLIVALCAYLEKKGTGLLKKTEGGIQFKVNGLSPVSIGWKEAARTDSAPSYQAPAPSSGETTATGDNSPILFYESLIAASVLGIGILIWRRKCEEMEG